MVKKEDKSQAFIGVFIANFNDAYQTEIWRGITKRALEKSVGLICFSGSLINSPIITESVASKIYSLAEKRNIDGLIIISSAIFTYLSKNEIINYFQKQSVPTVSVGIQIPGFSGISVNGEDGLESIIQHLIDKHKRKRFALLSGPPEHEEIKDREKVFFRILKNQNIPFDSKLYYHGDFQEESGKAAVDFFISSGKKFDAVVCLNDRMAIGALAALQAAGYLVPKDISITGFDNIEESGFCNPPLTTVQQPLSSLGSCAVDEICTLLETGEQSHQVLHCSPIFRESCGCPPDLGYWNEAPDKILKNLNPRDKNLINELITLLEQSNEDRFILRLNQILQQALYYNRGLEEWYNYFSMIQHQLAKTKDKADDSQKIIYNRMMKSAFILLEQVQSRYQASLRFISVKEMSALRAVGSSLAEAFEIEVILDRLDSGLTSLGISQAFVGILSNTKNPLEAETLLLLNKEAEGINFSAEGLLRYTSLDILPDKISDQWRKGIWFLSPLVFQDELLGYLILPGNNIPSSIYETLTTQLATTLKGALLLAQVHTHEKSLEEKVAKRTSELVKVNKRHTLEIERRITLEKEVAEISNQTMNRIGQDLHDDLCQYLAGISMMVIALKNSLKTTNQKAIVKTEQINSLLKESIVRVKHIVRGLVPTGLKEQGLAVAVESLIEELQRTYKGKISFKNNLVSQPLKNDRELQIYRIIQEALSNAIRHSEGNLIQVSLSESKYLDAGLCIEAIIKDNGKGIIKKTSQKGMGLKIMRYRAEKEGGTLTVEDAHPGVIVSCKVNIKEGFSDGSNC